MCGGCLSFNLILTVYTFDMAVSHLSLTSAERESQQEETEEKREKEAVRGAGGSARRGEGGVGGGCWV